MVNIADVYLWKKHLPSMLAMRSGDLIPRTGEDGELVNTFVIYLKEGDTNKYLLDRIDGEKIVGMKWSGTRFDEEDLITYDEITKLQPEINHYYGLNDVVYNSIYEFALHKTTKIKYLKIHYRRLISHYNRNRFSKKKLIVHDRIKILKFMVHFHTLSGGDLPQSLLDVASGLYSPKFWIHPKANQHISSLELYLNSLVISGELIRNDLNYVVTGKAIETISHYEMDEARYDQQLTSQKLTIYLTCAIALLAVLSTLGTLVQAKIISVPTLWTW